MPEHLRALVVILAIAAAVFAFSRKAACAICMAPADFNRRRNIWFALTLTAFLAHNFWLYVIISAGILWHARKKEHNPFALFLFVLFAVPLFEGKLNGVGFVSQLLVIDNSRILVTMLLLPTAFAIRKKRSTRENSWHVVDFLVFGYLAIQLLLRWEVDTSTNTLRYVIYALLDVVLPYYVASRSLRSGPAIRDALMSWCVGGFVLGAIAVFEAGRHWLLYRPLAYALGASGGVGNYLNRGELLLRAQGSMGHPLALGFVMVVLVGIVLFLRHTIPPSQWRLGFATILLGLFASVSRGPWLAAGLAGAIFALTGRDGVRELFKWTAIGFVGLMVVLISPWGEGVKSVLPFVGTVEAANVTYRQRLLEISLLVAKDNLWFGSYSFLYHPAMQELYQHSQGIIDVVNTYIGILLANGLIALSCFVGSFLYAMYAVWVCMRRITDKTCEAYTLGRALIASVIGAMVTIFTTSSIFYIPIVSWIICGICVAYARLPTRERRRGESATAAREQEAWSAAQRPGAAKPRPRPSNTWAPR